MTGIRWLSTLDTLGPSPANLTQGKSVPGERAENMTRNTRPDFYVRSAQIPLLSQGVVLTCGARVLAAEMTLGRIKREKRIHVGIYNQSRPSNRSGRS